MPERYADGGVSGGTLDRPALKRLLTEIDEGLIDRIVVYKVDRLTRSLSDFARLVERLDAAGCSFAVKPWELQVWRDSAELADRGRECQ